MKRCVALGLLWMLAAVVPTALALEPCHGRADLVGPCFRVRGRAALYNGNPTIRIWKIGTRRLLGVSQSHGESVGVETLPGDIGASLDWEHPVFADFVVCPFTRERPGVMQLVCIAAVSKVRTRAGRRITRAVSCSTSR